MDAITYHASNNAELERPLDIAIADAVRSRKHMFRLLLASGTYERTSLDLLEGTDLSVQIVCDGDAPAVFRGATLDLEGRTIEIRNVVIETVRSDTPALRIRVAEAATVERVAILSTNIGATDVSSSVLEIIARSLVHPPDPVTPARAALSDVWIVGSKVLSDPHGNAAVIGFPDRGRGYFDHIEIERLVLANNTAPAGIDVDSTSSVTLRDITVIEPDLKVPWLKARDPDARIQIDGGFIAVGASVIGTKTNLPEIAAHNVEIRGAAPGERIAQATNTFGPRLRPIRDWGFVLTPARVAAIPDRAALTASLR